MIKIEIQGKLLTATSKPYDFNGMSGVSSKLRIMIDGEIYVVKTTSDTVKELTEFCGQDLAFGLVFTSRKEMLGLELDSWEVLG